MPRAKANPVISTPVIETAEQPLGHTVRTKPTKDNPLGDLELVSVAERTIDPEKDALMKFMEEYVTIRPATSTDPNAEQIFEITVNGRTELFRRGENKTVKRKYVDRMCLMKVTAYGQKDVVSPDGERQIVNVPRTALKYDFAMVEDKNPMGESWLKATLAMGG